MESPENECVRFETAEQIILRWDSTASEDARVRMIFDGDRHEIDRYLQVVDEIQRSMESTKVSEDDDNQSNKVNSALQIAMARLEDEFQSILISQSTLIENDSLIDLNSSVHSIYTSRTKTNSTVNEVPDNDYKDGDSFTKDAIILERGESSTTIASYRSMNSIREIDLMSSESIYDLRSLQGTCLQF